MAVDKGVTKVITNAQDGKAYFKYPLGVIPAGATYDDMRVLSGQSGDSYYLDATNFRINGTFDWSATDPNSNGDDGGIVIAASNGWWVRSFAYDINNPIELDWYELADQADITQLLKNINADQGGYCYVRMPSLAVQLLWTDTAQYLWSSREFYLLSSAADTELYFNALNQGEFWDFTDVDSVVFGSATETTDIRLSFLGPWTPTNRGTNLDDGQIANTVAAFRVREPYSSGGCDVVSRVNMRKFTSIGLQCNGSFSGDTRIKIAGEYRYGVGFGALSNCYVHFEDAYFSDEVGFGGGWLGDASGALDRTKAHIRGGYWQCAASASSTLVLTGKATQQYGWAQWQFLWPTQMGNGIDDPFEIHGSDYTISGPNDLGWPEDVNLDWADWVNRHMGKFDGFSQTASSGPSTRHVKFTVSGRRNTKQFYDNTNFWESNQADSGGSLGAYTQQGVFIHVNDDGKSAIHAPGAGESGHVDNTFSDNIICGNGVDPAFIMGSDPSNIYNNGTAWIALRDEVCYAQVARVDIYAGKGTYTDAPGKDCDIHDITMTGYVTVNDGCGSNEMNRVRFMGTAREVLLLPAGATMHCNDISGEGMQVVNGRTTAGADLGAGTLYVNGVTKTLPYTFLSGDAITADSIPDVPPNPLVGQ